MRKEIQNCRICGNHNLIPIIHLGKQYLTGVFPKTKEQIVPCGPLELVKCQEDSSGGSCGLVQLKQSYEPEEMYGMNYGYRSGLNASMVNHLRGKVRSILKRVSLSPDDIVVDIGSNDSTLLQSYHRTDVTLVGIDPTAEKFREYYPDYIDLLPNFFSAELFKRKFGERTAKIITSIAMFYDLEDPLGFMREVHDILTDDGVWVFEQSYMPAMLEKNAYDTICHEHLEYYRLKQIKWMTDRAGFKIVDIEFNEVNSGSFSVTAAKSSSTFDENETLIQRVLYEEERKGLDDLAPYREFKDRVYKHREELCGCIERIRLENRLILGYGASTKGNVILQFCGFTESDIPFIAEVNKEKFGCLTPGTFIPIVAEEEARRMKPDCFLVLPWHFKRNFLQREHLYLRNGGKLLFPLPNIEIVES
jgi:hypothetical protein